MDDVVPACVASTASFLAYIVSMYQIFRIEETSLNASKISLGSYSNFKTL